MFLFAAVLCLFSTGMVAFAAEKVDQSNLPPWAGGWTHINPTPDGQASMWQTFTPEQSNITVVEIDIFTINPGRGDDTLTVEIAKDGEILASVERYVEDGFEGLLRFEIDEAVAVVPGELYELKVHDTGLTRFGWKYAANTYDAGSRYVSANERSGSDWLFQTYSAVIPRIIYVDDDAAGANDGSSWENAYTFLQDALADANSAEKPIEIRVAQGIYRPDQGASQTPSDRTASFRLINGVAIKGGYAGAVEPNTVDIELFETILSGDLDVNDVIDVNEKWALLFEPTRYENSFHVVTGSSTDRTAVLDGCTISGGNASGFGFPFSGGGMYNENGNPTLSNCKFTANSALMRAGGIYNFYSNPVLTNCMFIWNSGCSISGGMYNYHSNPILIDCTFRDNDGGTNGGGIYNDISNPTLIRCRFISNMGDYGGGMFNADSNPTLTNCTFTQNMPCWSATDVFPSGGGMYNFSNSNPILTNCIFNGNRAEYDGGGMYNFNSSPILTNCTFAENSAENGNALACNSNQAPSTVELINCILWNGGDEIWNGDNSTIAITYSNIQGGFPGEGNIDVNPEFVRGGYWTQPSPRSPNSSVWIEGDYHLKSEAGRWDPVSESWIIDNLTSHCIDAGDPNSPVGDETDPNGGRINMGAYGGTAEASKSPGYSWLFETTQGPVLAKGLGIVLPHEHIFTDLRGPTTPGYGQADAADVVRVMAPLLSDAREKGVGVLIECSSIGVGRNVSIIAQVAEASGLPVVVPTGVYGRANFAPPEHRNMTEDELATLFISEIQDGIEGTGIKAGFIKIATDEGPMNALLEKILRAAGRAASETSAAIASHTPTGSNAVQQVDILESIDPAIRFIWVHAQNESNRSIHRQLAARGAYIEFDSLGWNPGQDSTYIAAIKNLLSAGHGDKILLSHDAGWYQPGSVNGGTQKPFTYLIDTFIPKLRDAGVDDADIRMITQTNPVRAFGFKSGE